MSFNRAFEDVIIKEGGYSDNPLDSGGKTKYGITEAVARSNEYLGEMKDLPLEKAKDIYRKSYWDKSNLEEVCSVSEKLAHKLFDAGVNVGVTRANKWLQTVLNALNNREKRWSDLTIDGGIGNKTCEAIETALIEVGEGLIMKAYKCLQGAFYINLALKREKDEAFLRGWLNNRV